MKTMFLTAASVVGLGLLLLFGAAPTVHAQDSKMNQPAAQTEPPPWIHIAVIRVKPSMNDEFLKLAKETIPAHRKAGVEWRDFWVTDTFGNFSEFTIVTPFDKFAQYDKGSMLEQGFGKAGFEAWRAKVSQVVESVSSSAVKTRPDLGFDEMTTPLKLGVMMTTRVTPGREQEYENFVKNELLPVLKRSGMKALFVGQAVFGANADAYVALAPIEDFADIDKGPPIRRVLNQTEAEQLMKKLAPGVVVSQTRSIVRYLPELSYMPAKSETSSKKN